MKKSQQFNLLCSFYALIGVILIAVALGLASGVVAVIYWLAIISFVLSWASNECAKKAEAIEKARDEKGGGK